MVTANILVDLQNHEHTTSPLIGGQSYHQKEERGCSKTS
jgi:hypothetical protein